MPHEFRTHAPGRSVDRLAVGDTARVTRTFSREDVEAFARISGDDNPAHVDDDYVGVTGCRGRLVHGVLEAGLISAVVGTSYPAPARSTCRSRSDGWPRYAPGGTHGDGHGRGGDRREEPRVLDTVVTRAGEPCSPARRW